MRDDFSPHARAWLSAAVIALPLMLAACGGGGGGGSSDSGSETPGAPDPTPAGPRNVVIDFSAEAAGQPVRCGSEITGIGTGQVPVQLRDLRFYVSNIALITDKNEAIGLDLERNDWQTRELVLIDLEDGTGACADVGTPELNHQIRGKVPAGTYKGVRMTIGVPPSLNHTDYAVADKPLDIQAMAWSWQAGRKFAKIEVDPEGGVARPAPAAPGKTFYVHLGSTGCTGNPVTGETVSCARPGRMDFALPDFEDDKHQVVLDIAKLFAGSNVNEDRGGAPGCMSGMNDPECEAIFHALQIDLITGRPIHDGRDQSVLRIEAK